MTATAVPPVPIGSPPGSARDLIARGIAGRFILWAASPATVVLRDHARGRQGTLHVDGVNVGLFFTGPGLAFGSTSILVSLLSAVSGS